MCNHYQAHPEALQSWREYIGWSLPHEPFSQTQIDVWPKRHGMVARLDKDGSRIFEPMIWGVPMTMPGKRPGTKVTKHITNVRNLQSPFWRSMLAKPEQRCLVPFTRFAEPVIGGGRAEHWFSLKDRPVAAFAGIWRWAAEVGPAVKAATPTDLFGNMDDAGEGVATEKSPAKVFAFLTCEPNPLVAPLHPKAMPVILHAEDYGKWLTADWAEAQGLVTCFPSQLMEAES